jgi:hypothetical protein
LNLLHGKADFVGLSAINAIDKIGIHKVQNMQEKTSDSLQTFKGLYRRAFIIRIVGGASRFGVWEEGGFNDIRQDYG